MQESDDARCTLMTTVWVWEDGIHRWHHGTTIPFSWFRPVKYTSTLFTRNKGPQFIGQVQEKDKTTHIADYGQLFAILNIVAGLVIELDDITGMR